jgi:hypothetical protein
MKRTLSLRAGAAQGSEATRAELGAAAPEVIARQVDVLPA